MVRLGTCHDSQDITQISESNRLRNTTIDQATRSRKLLCSESLMMKEPNIRVEFTNGWRVKNMSSILDAHVEARKEISLTELTSTAPMDPTSLIK